MKYLLILFTILSINTLAQTNPTVKDKIQNKKSNKHTNILGTRLYLEAPAGFKPSTTFIGLQKGQNAIFNVYDLTEGNFYTNAANYNREAFEGKGIKVYEYKEITINNFPARYLHLRSEDGSNAYTLVFGDSSFSVMIMGMCAENDQQTGNDIITAINSIYYDKSKIISPFETAAFTIDETASRFKYFKYQASIYFYTLDGKDYSLTPNSPYILLMQFPADASINAKDVKTLLINKMAEKGFADIEIKNNVEVSVNPYETSRAEAHGMLNGKPTVLCLYVISNGTKIIALEGIVTSDVENNLVEFYHLAETVKIK